LDDDRLDAAVEHITGRQPKETIDRDAYFRELLRLQRELIRLQDWVVHQKLKLVVLFEGRDAAGKGGVIKRVTQRLNPRMCKVVALPAPTERERSQWYFQRYTVHLPAAGEIVLFDRSWYNRAGVERVIGFCSEADCEEFFRTVPEFERMLVRSGIILVKYWFSITDEEQNLRFLMRIHDPLKQWKLSAMDLESRRRWEHYTYAKEDMFQRTHIPEARWWVIEGVDKKRARLNCIHHLLQQIPYGTFSTNQSQCRNGSISRITRATRFPRRCMCRRCISFSLRSPRGERSQLPPFTLAIYRPSERTTPTLVPKSWPANSSIPRLVGSKVPLLSRVTFPGKRETMIAGACLETL
jgi:polyphosphate kinase